MNPLFLLIPVWLGLRVMLLLTGAESIFNFDEFELGTIAKELISGLKLPYWNYQIDAYSGESLFLGLFLGLFFKLFGPSLFALKFLPFFFSFLTFLLSLFFLNRYWGRRAAILGGLLLIFPMPTFVQLSFLTFSGHTEFLIFVVAMLICFYEYHTREIPKLRYLAGFGLMAGFSTWIYYSNLIPFIACVLAGLIWRKGRYNLKEISFVLLFFFLGFSPWLLMNLQNGFAGITYMTQAAALQDHSLWDVVKKAARFLLKELPFSFSTVPFSFISEKGFSLFYFVIFSITLLGFAIKQKPNIKTLFFYFYPVCFLIFFAACPLDLQPEFDYYGYRYLPPLMLWACWFAAILLSQSSLFSRIFISILLCLGIVSQLPLFFHTSPDKIFRYKGYSYYHFAFPWHLAGAYQTLRFPEAARAAQQLDSKERFFLYWGLIDAAAMFNQTYVLNPEGDPEAVLKDLPSKALPFYYEWMAVAFSPDSAEKTLAQIQTIPAPWRKYYWLSWFLNHPADISPLLEQFSPEEQQLYFFAKGGRIYAEMFQSFSEQRRFNSELLLEPTQNPWVLRGFGAAAVIEGIYFKRNLSRQFLKRTLETASGMEQIEIAWGLGWGIRSRYREDRVRAHDWTLRLAAEHQAPAQAGMKAFEVYYGIYNAP